MKKIIKDYISEYGEILSNGFDRYDEILKQTSKKSLYKKPLTDLILKISNIEWNRYHFIVYLLPKATPRPRCNTKRSEGSFVFYVKGAKDNKDIFSKFILSKNLNMITTPCKFKCISYFPIPKSMDSVEKLAAELKFIRPISKPDWDNLGKTYSDAIQGSLLYDDSLIIKGVSEKYYSFKPRIELIIEYMSEYDSEYNYKKMRKKVE